MKQRVIFTEHIDEALSEVLGGISIDKLFVLTDTTTHNVCLPLLMEHNTLGDFHEITIPSGETAKQIDTLQSVWRQLSENDATRNSLFLCLGGGMICDLGGFAAATFKRGMRHINIPTTLLCMVDAAVGGKTGINFCGLKNEIGCFSEADCVVISTQFLASLDQTNLLSGYAEMLKHALLSDEMMWSEHINYDFSAPNMSDLLKMIQKSVEFKQQIVEQDPHEQGLRRALNFGHTIGHAIESLRFEVSGLRFNASDIDQSRETKPQISNLKSQTSNGEAAQTSNLKRRSDSNLKPLSHGYSVAFGMISELYLSAVLCGFPTDRLRQTVRFVKENYGDAPITCDDYDRLLELMRHDKKNVSSKINFTLLENIGKIRINQTANDALIREALDFLREA